MSFNNNSRIALLAGAAFVAFMATAAHAQSAPAPVAAADGQTGGADATAADDQSMPDIIVTATKSNERLKDVPASISVVTATDMTKGGITRFADYAARIPGLSFTSGRTGNTQVTLRGITTGSSQPGSTTAFYVDEAPVGSVNAYTGGNGITPDLDPSDLAQIEVLKGPQGTLYGAGAVGGLLKFTTVEPNLSTIEGSASAGVNTVAKGDVGYSARGMFNLPLVTDRLGLHVSGFYRRDAGYIDNVNPVIGGKDANDAKIRGGRAVLSMKFTPELRLDLSATLQDTTTGAANIVDVDSVTLKPIYGDLKQNRFAQETGRVRLRLYNATWRADLGKVNIVSSTTYQRIFSGERTDASRTFGAAFAGLSGIADLGAALNTYKHSDRWSEEARVTANDLAGGILDVQAGFYWTYEGDKNRINNADLFHTATGVGIPSISVPAYALFGIPTTSPYGLVFAKIDSSYQEFSGFGNIRLHFGQKFDILGGVRYAHDKQKYSQDYEGLLIPAITGFAFRQLVAVGAEKANVATWLVSPRFKISDDFMIYGRAASGYRPGGPNPAPPSGGVPLTFQPDRLIQYEVGFKASAMNKLLSVDAALFYTDWNNIQVQTSAGGFNFIVNGGKARSQGGEVTIRLQPATGLSFGLNAAYTDAKLTSDAPRAKGINGDRLPYVPRLSGSFTADYSATLSGSTKLNLGAALNYTGNRISDYSGNFPKHLPAYATVDLRAGLDFGSFNLSAFARNLTDKRAIVVVGTELLATNNTAGSPYAAGVLTPRTIGLEASVKF
ncbi:TonB-dependent receptor [Sphingomonas panacisoli]|uniref:TonB-dependent receptor n=1 Tax=Sphingomonas panacisoli TaxID=1813879 RepID=A0A5B8LK49_9SPHN|nr:TonB-dependent receptor [Sphingomonas panacisoli]QDZ08627.1 TonB-dependent receptor [Sphingomonas panacisoli]